MKTVVIEGWRFLPHSYAIVNQYQCLEMLRRPDLKVYHRDVPYFVPQWTPKSGVLPVEYEDQLRAMETPPPGLKADALLRIGFPHFFDKPREAERTFTWVTSETKTVADEAIGSGLKAWQAISNTQSTIIACSRWAAQGFLNCGAPKAKVMVVPCGVDTDIFRPGTPDERAETRRVLGWGDRFVALNISAVTQNKGIDLVMRAVGRLAATHPQVALSIKGSDDLYSSSKWAAGYLAHLPPAEKAAAESRVFYLGHTMSALDMARLYRAADVYVSPYRAEGFNLPVLEAAACGLPVICTRGGSTEDFVDDSWCLRIDAKEMKDGASTFLQPDFDHLTTLLERVMDDEAWRRSAAAAGPVWASGRFTWRHTVDKLLGVMLG